MSPASHPSIIDQGELSFTIESRLLRELGERLVKQPEVAIVELIKNSYDADASQCEIRYEPYRSIAVIDDGIGMTLKQFRNGWMRIGTSSKESTPYSPRYGRRITGEKGIGRFAVRFLGRRLHLESVANDPEMGYGTRLTADFDWPQFDEHEDLGQIKVPYVLERLDDDRQTGTSLTISQLRTQANDLDLQRVRTDSIGVLSPLRSLFRELDLEESQFRGVPSRDPGFLLLIQEDDDSSEDVAASILDAYVLRATIKLDGSTLELKVYRRGQWAPYMSIVDQYPNEIEFIRADIRFFPRRKGVFANTNIDGRRAYSWITGNSGVAVFDRDFRVQPYGSRYDDWLQLARDSARRTRDPRSSITQKHFPMTPEEKGDTATNWMLRLPQSAQLIGIVNVQGRRIRSRSGDDSGLIAAADREGFVANKAYGQLQDIVRGAVEAIARSDRRVQQEEAEAQRQRRLEEIRRKTQDAVDQIRNSPTIASGEKNRIIDAITQTQILVEQHEESARERERQLEVMSLLGVVAGFMTHEFGSALQDLKDAQADLRKLADVMPQIAEVEKSLAQRIKNLTDFVTYSQGYVAGSAATPTQPYKVLPRIQQIVRVFGQYARERNIEIEVVAENDLFAPLVPVSLYNGIALNLYTNALKAVTARSGTEPRVIAFRAWNDHRLHYLEVSDTGIGIPEALQDKVFDALFTTTSSRRDPLGSGMGLGLTLVRQGVEAFGGKVDIVEPPPSFVTCVRIRLPLALNSG